MPSTNYPNGIKTSTLESTDQVNINGTLTVSGSASIGFANGLILPVIYDTLSATPSLPVAAGKTYFCNGELSLVLPPAVRGNAVQVYKGTDAGEELNVSVNLTSERINFNGSIAFTIKAQATAGKGEYLWLACKTDDIYELIACTPLWET